MNIPNMRAHAAAILFFASLGEAVLWTRTAHGAGPTAGRERARTVFTHALPRLDGSHLKVTVVRVRYGPGESSQPHSHPCPVTGYVLEGAYRTQVEGEPEAIYKAGDAFYEAPNGHHLLSANASQTEPVTFIAQFICDHDGPLSTNASVRFDKKGHSK